MLKKLLLNIVTLAFFLFLAHVPQVDAADFRANAKFKNDVYYYGIYGDPENDDWEDIEGIVYAMYEDFDNNGFKDLYYIKLTGTSINDCEYEELLYINNELVYQNQLPGLYPGLASTTSLNIAYYNNQLYRGLPAYTRAWPGGGILIQRWENGKFKDLADFYYINDDPEEKAGFRYYFNNKQISKSQYDKLYAPYKSIPWIPNYYW